MSDERIKSFTDLETWQVARELRRRIYLITSSLPSDEKYNLVSQMRRAAVSVAANIAEGYGRYQYQENIQLLRVARGSVYEIIDHLTTCFDLKYIADSEFKSIQELTIKSIQLLNGLIRYLNKTKIKKE